jgi:RNA polymerase sigma factor (sigma-70 family)
MAGAPSSLLRHVHHLVAGHTLDRLTDHQLLERFAAERGEAEFALLLRRHGPMVLGLCRRLLGHEQDAEDVFQAAFLILARKAGAIRQADVGGFLYRVAYHLAVRARGHAARQKQRENQVGAASRAALGPVRLAGRTSADLLRDVTWHEVRSVVDEELQRLPDALRSAVVLCYLEGKTHEEVAQHLGWSKGTLRRRLHQGREMLRRRLLARGLAPAAALTATLFAEGDATAAVTAKLAGAAVRGAINSASVSPAVAALAEAGWEVVGVGKAKLATALLLVASLMTGAGWWASRGPEVQAVASPPPAAKQGVDRPRADSPPKQKVPAVEVGGRVLDPDGKPLAGARLYWYSTVLRRESFREAHDPKRTSAADGRFRFPIPQSEIDNLEQDTCWDQMTVVAVAPGYGPGWVEFSRSDEAAGLTVRLVKDDVPINARILDLEGRPIPGVTIRATAIKDAQSGNLDLDVLPALQKETTTDAQGRFRLTGMGRDRDVQVTLRGPTIAAKERTLYVRTRIAEPVHELLNKRSPDLGKISYYGATSDIVAAPTRPILGTVRDKDTGKPLAGVTLQSELMAGSGTLLQEFLQTTTDAEGRYRLVEMPKGRGNRIAAVVLEGQPYFRSQKDVADTLGLDPVRVDFALKRGVWIRGRVTDKVTGKSVRARVRYGVFLDNPPWRAVPGYDGSVTAVTRDDGSFTVLGMPGRGLLAVKAMEDRYLPSAGAEKIPAADKANTNFEWIQSHPLFVTDEYHAFAPVNPAEDGKDAACDIALDPGRSVEGTILGPDDKPLGGVRMMDLKLMWTNPPPLPGANFTATALDPRNPRWLYFHHREKQLRAAVLVRGDEKDPLTVRLQPCGSVTGRILDGKGLGRPEWTVYGWSENQYMSLTTGRWWQLYVSGRTDKQGRFRISLIPGVTYNIIVGSQNHSLTLKPGESKDLGDVRTE